MVRDQTGWMLDMLGDPAQTGVVIVAAPEEMPVNETLELADRLAERDGRRPRRRRRQPRPARAVRARRGGGVRAARPRRATRRASARRSARSVRPILDGAQLAVTLRRTRAAHLTRLREELPAGTPLLYVPYLFQRSHGARATRQVAEHLAEELGF